MLLHSTAAVRCRLFIIGMMHKVTCCPIFNTGVVCGRLSIFDMVPVGITPSEFVHARMCHAGKVYVGRELDVLVIVYLDSLLNDPIDTAGVAMNPHRQQYIQNTKYCLLCLVTVRTPCTNVQLRSNAAPKLFQV